MSPFFTPPSLSPPSSPWLCLPRSFAGPSSCALGLSPSLTPHPVTGQVQLPGQRPPVCQRLPCSLLNTQLCLHQTSLWGWQSLGQLTCSNLNSSNPHSSPGKLVIFCHLLYPPRPSPLTLLTSANSITCWSHRCSCQKPENCPHSVTLHKVLLIFSAHYLLCLSSPSLWPRTGLCSVPSLTFQHPPR